MNERPDRTDSMSKETRAAEVTPPKECSPNRAERLGLIQALQCRALKRTDPLAANIEMFTGDLMQFAYQMRESLEETLVKGTASPQGSRQWERKVDTYLKVMRQIDRLTQIGRQLTAPENDLPSPLSS